MSVRAPIIATVLYPRAKWLFAFLFLGIALVIVGIVTRKQPTPTEAADRAARLLDGSFGGYDVDNYEHLNPKDEQLNDLWQKMMGIGGLPEEWVKLDEAARKNLRKVIEEIRQLAPNRS